MDVLSIFCTINGFFQVYALGCSLVLQQLGSIQCVNSDPRAWYTGVFAMFMVQTASIQRRRRRWVHRDIRLIELLDTSSRAARSSFGHGVSSFS
ncbi:hypothetical protein BDN71DRAFT_1253751 [Pleurotus eryngii]|uniref:Uncharacterized protein n=1 Tax=Pleurotus eryngii TaxID=5323 RepID=A0A9P6AA59_PLEER|nr:hypothetical protein BDN71DRAFT_1253751 [Pleurotus eryngii]